MFHITALAPHIWRIGSTKVSTCTTACSCLTLHFVNSSLCISCVSSRRLWMVPPGSSPWFFISCSLMQCHMGLVAMDTAHVVPPCPAPRLLITHTLLCEFSINTFQIRTAICWSHMYNNTTDCATKLLIPLLRKHEISTNQLQYIP